MPLQNKTNLNTLSATKVFVHGKDTGNKAKQLENHSRSEAKAAKVVDAIGSDKQEEVCERPRPAVATAGAQKDVSESCRLASGLRSGRSPLQQPKASGQQVQMKEAMKSPALIDLSTPMPLRRNEGTPDWVKELSQAQNQQQSRLPAMDSNHVAALKYESESLERKEHDKSKLVSEVLLLLDEKTQECRELYSIMKQLDQASSGPSATTADPAGPSSRVDPPLERALANARTLEDFRQPSRPHHHHPLHHRDGKQKQPQDQNQDHHCSMPSRSACTQTPQQSYGKRCKSRPAGVDEKEKLVAKLEMILLEAKREPSSEQAEMLHVPSTSSSTSALGTTVVGASGISVLETLRGENMALQQENHLLSARIQKLEAENARMKKDQRECLEAVNKADQLILKVLSQQQNL